MSDVRTRRTFSCLCELKNKCPQSAGPEKFHLESTPFNEEDDDDDSSLPAKEDWHITGQVFPKSAIYGNQPVPIKIVIGLDFPAKPPKVFSRVKLYHPNVDEKGEICTDLLKQRGTWTLSSTLLPVIAEVTKTLDTPSIDNMLDDKAADLFKKDQAAYEKRAKETFEQNQACSTR